MGKKRLKHTATGSRCVVNSADGVAENQLAYQPGPYGNDFDIILADEEDHVKAAEKIVRRLTQRGVVLIEAGASPERLEEAEKEAQALAGAFGPPIPPTAAEARVWHNYVYMDDPEVKWISVQEDANDPKEEHLRSLARNMMDIFNGIIDILIRETRGRLSFTHAQNAMLSRYTGSRDYSVHVDNRHECDPNMPDNGLRLTMCYWLCTTWDAETEPQDNGGGLDVFLTGPERAPETLAKAREAKVMRIAPHADTLVIFLSEKMAHQVIKSPNNSKSTRYCLTMWAYDDYAMDNFMPLIMMQDPAGADADADSD